MGGARRSAVATKRNEYAPRDLRAFRVMRLLGQVQDKSRAASSTVKVEKEKVCL